MGKDAALDGIEIFGFVAMVYGVVAGLAVLLQARELLARRSSCGVSARFFATYAGGYAIWLLYGASAHDIPLVVVDAVGLLSATATLAVILALRGSLSLPRHRAGRWTRASTSPCIMTG